VFYFFAKISIRRTSFCFLFLMGRS